MSGSAAAPATGPATGAEDVSADEPTREEADRAIAEATAEPDAPEPNKPLDADWTPENTDPAPKGQTPPD